MGNGVGGFQTVRRLRDPFLLQKLEDDQSRRRDARVVIFFRVSTALHHSLISAPFH